MALLSSAKPSKDKALPRRRRATKVIPPRMSCVILNGLANYITMEEVSANYHQSTVEIGYTAFDRGMVWRISQVNEARYQRHLGGCLHYAKTDLSDGLSKMIRPKAKLCVLLMVSHSDEYSGGEVDGKRLSRGTMVFFDPSVRIPSINPVTPGACKAYLISAFRMYGIQSKPFDEQVQLARSEAGVPDDMRFEMGMAINEEED